MAWNVWVTDTVTGVKQQRLPVSAFTWSRVLNGGGSGSATVQLSDSVTRLLDVKTLTVPTKNTLVLERDGVVVYAGVIWSRTYDHTAGTLTLEHGDLWSMLGRRLAVDHYVGVVSTWNVTYTNLTLRQYAKNLVILGIFGDANANMMLPITLPADETGTISRTIYGYHLPNLLDSLDDVMGEDGGPDIDFQPRWVSGALNWLMRVGSTATPKLSSGSWEWNLGAEQSGIVGLSVTDDSVKQVTNMIAVGEGSEADMLIRSNRIVNPVFPHMERVSSFKDESNAVRLANLATGNLNVYKTTTTQWGFSMRADGTPAVTDLLLGGTAKVWVRSDPWLPDGFTSSRLVQYSGDLTENVALQFQPDGGV